MKIVVIVIIVFYVLSWGPLVAFNAKYTKIFNSPFLLFVSKLYEPHRLVAKYFMPYKKYAAWWIRLTNEQQAEDYLKL